MKIKTVIYSVAIALAGVLADTTFAQSAPEQSGLVSTTAVTRAGRLHNPESIKRAKLTRLKKDVGLDDQQVHSVTPIIDSYVTAVQNVKNDASLDSRTRRLKLAELRKRYDSDVDALLTPEQQQKLASIKAERRARLRGAKTTSKMSQTSEAPGTSTVSAAAQ
jgi:MoxR-like ATPase